MKGSDQISPPLAILVVVGVLVALRLSECAYQRDDRYHKAKDAPSAMLCDEEENACQGEHGEQDKWHPISGPQYSWGQLPQFQAHHDIR
jgi:hypothetical protein